MEIWILLRQCLDKTYIWTKINIAQISSCPLQDKGTRNRIMPITSSQITFDCFDQITINSATVVNMYYILYCFV